MSATGATGGRGGLSIPIWLALTVGSSLNPLNSSMVSVAVIPIMRDFRISIGTATWVITSFYIAACVSQPLMGRLGDQLGARRVFPAGMAVALAASVGAAVAPSFGVLVAMRVLQSVGTAAAFPSAMLVLRREAVDASPIATAGTVAAAIGPVVGGLAILIGGWSAMFWLNVPLTITVGLVLAVGLKEDRPMEIGQRRWSQIADPGGAICFALGITGIVIFVLSLNGPVAWWALGTGVAGFLAFFRFETRVTNPFIDVRALARHRRLLATDAKFVLYNVVAYGVTFGLPALLEARGYSPGEVGLLLFPLAALTAVGTVVGPRLLRRLGMGRTSLLTYAWVTVGLASVIILPTGDKAWAAVVAGLILGLPYGVGAIVFQTAMVTHTPSELAGVSAGLFQTARYTGGIAASALIGLLFATGSPRYGLDLLMWVLLGVCAVLAALVLVDSVLGMDPAGRSRLAADLATASRAARVEGADSVGSLVAGESAADDTEQTVGGCS
jgi:MFS family permease